MIGRLSTHDRVHGQQVGRFFHGYYDNYRLVVKINYPYRVVYIRFVGTPAEYDGIDVEEVLLWEPHVGTGQV